MILVAAIGNRTEQVENLALPGSVAQGGLSSTAVAFWPVRNWRIGEYGQALTISFFGTVASFTDAITP